MTKVDVRAAVPEDAEAMAALRRVVFPYLMTSPAQLRYSMTEGSPAERHEWYVVEDGRGAAIGMASSGLSVWTSEAGAGNCRVLVHPARRRQGIGGALAECAHAHLEEIGAGRVQAFCTEDSVGFARARGYLPAGESHFAGVDPRVLPPLPETPSDVTLAPLAEVEPRLVYDADALGSLDEPGEMPADAMTYDDWYRNTWAAPAQNPALGVAALVDGKVACFTSVETDGDRAFTGFTTTVREHRGRGLAKLVKSVALRRAAEAGITAAYTSNDAGNPAMLAVNDWLGYRRVATHISCVRDHR